MNLDRFFKRIRQILAECGAKKILFIGEAVPDELVSNEWSLTIGKPDDHGSLSNRELFDSAVLIGGLASFDPLLLFEQVRRRVRGFVAIAVKRSFIGDPRNIEWTGGELRFGAEALKEMLEIVGFKKVELKSTSSSIVCYAWSHEPIKIFNKAPQMARIVSVEVRSKKGLFLAELKKPLEIEVDIRLKNQTAFLRVVAESDDKRYISESPTFLSDQKIVARCDSWAIAGRCFIKLELLGKVRGDWEILSFTEPIEVEADEIRSDVEVIPESWAFIKRLSLEHYERLNEMACYRSGGALRVVCEFEGSKPESLGLLVRLFDKSGFILNQTAITAPEIRELENGFELVCDCSSLPLAKGVYKLGVSPISYDSSVNTFSEEEREVWFEVAGFEGDDKELLNSKFALDKLECVEQKAVLKPSIVSVHSPTRKVYWFTAEPNSPIWWETTFDWTGNAELSFRFQLILPMKWLVLLDKNTKDIGLDIDLPSGRWRAIFSISHLSIQGTVLLGKIDLEKDGEVVDSRHFWLAIPKIDFAQEGIILMPWKGAELQKSSLRSEDLKIDEGQEQISISVDMSEKSFVELSKIFGFERVVLNTKAFSKLALFELPKKRFADFKYVVASFKPFIWARDSSCIAGFSLGDIKIREEPLNIKWELG